MSFPHVREASSAAPWAATSTTDSGSEEIRSSIVAVLVVKKAAMAQNTDESIHVAASGRYGEALTCLSSVELIAASLPHESLCSAIQNCMTYG